jgi:uncharacterized protein
MQVNEIGYDDAKPVEGYGPGFFRIGGAVVEGAVICHPGGATPWGGLSDAAALLALAGEIDVLLMGMGADIAQVQGDLRARLEAAGIGVEVMATAAAARTYNVLLAEGRRVGAALLTV